MGVNAVARGLVVAVARRRRREDGGSLMLKMLCGFYVGGCWLLDVLCSDLHRDRRASRRVRRKTRTEDINYFQIATPDGQTKRSKK